MEDVSEYFKSGFISLCKNTIGKNYQQKPLRDRARSNFNDKRRETRSTLMFEKRQIDENMTLTPIPGPSKRIEKKDEKAPNKRLELLQKWKLEKQKRKLEEKQKSKPLFKVCRVPDKIDVPNLVNANKKTKETSKFAPPNHIFRAPKSIKPIHINYTSAKKKDASISISSKTPQKDKRSGTVANKDGTGSRRTTRKTTCDQLEKLKSVAKTDSRGKINTNNSIEPTNSKQKPTNVKIESKNVSSRTRGANLLGKAENKPTSTTKSEQDPVKSRKGSTTDKNKNEAKTTKHSKIESKKTLNKSKDVDLKLNKETVKNEKLELTSSKSSRKSVAKSVGWDCTDSSDDMDIKTPKTPKKKYNKTPRKTRKINTPDAQLTISESPGLNGNEPQSTPKDLRSNELQLTKRIEFNKLDLSVGKESETECRTSTVGSATGSASPDYPIDTNLTESTNVFRTPEKKTSRSDSPVYVSPFVTISRGKSSARKEYHVRQSKGEASPEFPTDILNSTSPKAGGEYFQKILNNEISKIEAICDVWESYKNSNELPEGTADMINVAIGQSKLLISKKFKQFQSLIDQCKKCEYVEKPITCEDLHGFWDMTYMQVEDLNKRFNNLEALKANNWEEIIPEKKVAVKRGRGRPKKVSASNGLKNLIKAAREMKKSNVEKETELSDATKEFQGGYYSVKSPVRTSNQPLVTNGSARRSLRVSLLTNQAKSRVSSSPGLTMMKISQAIKCGDGITPSKSILKTDLTRSEKRTTKSVLFKDDVEVNAVRKSFDASGFGKIMEYNVDKENNVNEINLITFSPVTPTRRSKRLNKA